MPSNYFTYQISLIILPQLSQEDSEILIYSKFHWNFNVRYPIYIYNIYWTHIGTIYSVKSLSNAIQFFNSPLKIRWYHDYVGPFHWQATCNPFLEKNRRNRTRVTSLWFMKLAQHTYKLKNSCLLLLKLLYTNLYSVSYNIILY